MINKVHLNDIHTPFDLFEDLCLRIIPHLLLYSVFNRYYFLVLGTLGLFSNSLSVEWKH